VPRGEEGGQENIARADARDRLDLRRDRAQPQPFPLLAEEPKLRVSEVISTLRAPWSAIRSTAIR
jgi:hypothetical protein